jgi:uncharacterized protein (TIGR02246 family)
MSPTEIAQVNQAFEESARKGDMKRLASLYTPDAMVLAPDAPVVKGRDAIQQFWTSAAQQMGLKDVRLTTLDLQLAGDTAYEVGEAQLTLQSGTAAVKYVVVWKKVDGRWSLHRDIWNAKAA